MEPDLTASEKARVSQLQKENAELAEQLSQKTGRKWTSSVDGVSCMGNVAADSSQEAIKGFTDVLHAQVIPTDKVRAGKVRNNKLVGEVRFSSPEELTQLRE
ncbi:MAG: hypothetical protein ACRCXC_02580 [Legionella sp.]